MVSQQNPRVRDLVDTAFIALDENTLVAEAARALYSQERGPFKVTLKDIMSAPIITIDGDKSVEEAIAILNKHKINRLPVVHDSSIIGLLTPGMIMSNVSIEKHSDTEL